MLVIDVELLHGTIRAGSPDDLALTGHDDPGEWPPSPARLFAALLSAGTRERWAFSDGSELSELEAAGSPEIRCDGSGDVAVSVLVERFVVTNDRATGTSQEYPARTSRLARPGARQCPKTPRVVYVWGGWDGSDESLEALARRAARVGYLGCADSPVRLRVGRDLPPDEGVPVWVPRPDGTTALPVPFVGLTDVLDRVFDDFTGHEHTGPPVGVRRSAYRADRAWYTDPDATAVPVGDQPTVLWMRFDRAVPGRKVLSVTETLRDAVLDLYPADRADTPAVLHGHTTSGGDAGHQQARWLALPRVGDVHADGRIHGAAVWLPAGTPPDVTEGVRAALARLQANGLVRPGRFSTGVVLHSGERRPWAAHPDRWVGPSTTWSTVFPAVHERWSRRVPTVDEIASWCSHAGLPAPVAARSRRHPFLDGAVDLHPDEAHREGRERRPYSHLEVRFASPVRGPVVIGRSRSFGLGLMAPVDGRSDD